MKLKLYSYKDKSNTLLLTYILSILVFFSFLIGIFFYYQYKKILSITNRLQSQPAYVVDQKNNITFLIPSGWTVLLPSPTDTNTIVRIVHNKDFPKLGEFRIFTSSSVPPKLGGYRPDDYDSINGYDYLVVKSIENNLESISYGTKLPTSPYLIFQLTSNDQDDI